MKRLQLLHVWMCSASCRTFCANCDGSFMKHPWQVSPSTGTSAGAALHQAVEMLENPRVHQAADVFNTLANLRLARLGRVQHFLAELQASQ